MALPVSRRRRFRNLLFSSVAFWFLVSITNTLGKSDRYSTRMKQHHQRSLALFLVLSLMSYGYCAGAAANSDPAAVVLQYHHVSSTTPPSTSISPADFSAHMQHLADAGVPVLPLSRVVAALQLKQQLPEQAVSITFDDAYLNIFETAWPILQSHGFPFTIFVATDLVGTNDRLYMSWTQLQQMADAGVEIANHTHTHAHLIRKLNNESEQAWLDRVKQEITVAERLLKTNIDAPLLKQLAYPYGEFNHAILELVASLGYVAFGQHSGAVGATSHLQALPRYPFGGIYTAIEPFVTKVASLPMPVVASLVDPASASSTPTLMFSLADRELQTRDLRCYGPGGQLPVAVSGTTVTVQAAETLPVGRSRYNCTMPSAVPHRFYWYSQLWIRKKIDGTWYEE